MSNCLLLLVLPSRKKTKVRFRFIALAGLVELVSRLVLTVTSYLFSTGAWLQARVCPKNMDFFSDCLRLQELKLLFGESFKSPNLWEILTPNCETIRPFFFFWGGGGGYCIGLHAIVWDLDGI